LRFAPAGLAEKGAVYMVDCFWAWRTRPNAVIGVELVGYGFA